MRTRQAARQAVGGPRHVKPLPTKSGAAGDGSRQRSFSSGLQVQEGGSHSISRAAAAAARPHLPQRSPLHSKRSQPAAPQLPSASRSIGQQAPADQVPGSAGPDRPAATSGGLRRSKRRAQRKPSPPLHSRPDAAAISEGASEPKRAARADVAAAGAAATYADVAAPGSLASADAQVAVPVMAPLGAHATSVRVRLHGKVTRHFLLQEIVKRLAESDNVSATT